MLIAPRRAVLRLYGPLAALLAALAVFLLLDSAHAQSNPCVTDNNAGYTVTLCLVAPENHATLSGATPVTATVAVSAAKPGVAKLVFYLDGEYLLTDFEAPFTFVLPTAAFADGAHTLSVKALLLDDYVTSIPALQLTFTNPQPTPPAANFTPVTPPAPPPGQSLVMAAVGDGAGGEDNAGRVTGMVAAWDPDLFLYLGDVYEKGTYTEFYNWYGQQDAFFGRLRAVTNPVIGNHEYENGDASGYFTYWHNVPDYYSYDAGGWHFIALNSTSEAGLTDNTSAQYQWLVSDLEGSSPCTIAYYHHPLLSIGPEGGSARMGAIFSALAQHGVDIVLTGHEHNYQRWVPLDAGLNPTSQGTTEFVVGAGGHGVQEFVSTDTRLSAGSDNAKYSFGALYFKLNPKGAEFRYINTDGQVLDQGVIPCSGAAPDTAAPTVPANLTAVTSASGHVALHWDAAWDETGVAGYNIYRNGVRIAALQSDKSAYTDRNVGLAVTYEYQVDAVDALGNRSPKSDSAAITRPARAALTFYALADTYVQSSAPAENYGAAAVLKVDGSPDAQSFLRFHVQGLDGVITSATLRLYANSGSRAGYDVYPVTGGGWAEMSTTYANKPATGDLAASSGSFAADAWTEVDVRPLITGNGLLEIAIKTSGSTAMNFSSCEGVHPPQLIITTASGAQANLPSSPLYADDEEQRDCPYLIDPADLILVIYTHAIFLPEVAGAR